MCIDLRNTNYKTADEFFIIDENCFKRIPFRTREKRLEMLKKLTREEIEESLFIASF